MSKLVLVADEAAPSTPAAGQAIYTESGRLKRQSSGGTVRYLDAVSGAGVLTLATDTAITGGGTVALGGFTLTVPATGTAALLATSQTFTAAQNFGTGATGAQVAIKSAAAGTIALLVNTAASPTANAQEWRNNGTQYARINVTGRAVMELSTVDNSTSIGPTFVAGRNSNASTPASGNIAIINKDGTTYYLWVDATGDLRIGTTAPTNANDTSGTVVGTQS